MNKKMKFIIIFLSVILVVSSLLSFSNSAEASKKYPKKGVVVSQLGNSVTRVIVTDVYLNKTEAKKLSKKLKNKNTKEKDVGMFLVSLVPRIGIFLGANYMIEGWKLKEDAAKIDSLIKKKGIKGIRVHYTETTGRGESPARLVLIKGWKGKRSTIKSHHKVSKEQKQKLSHSVEKKIYN